MISPKQVADVWSAAAPIHTQHARLRSYYRGEQSVAALKGRRLDGRIKSHYRTNWVRYAITQHAGFLLANALNYTLPRGRDAAELQPLTDAYRRNQLAAADRALMADAILYGYAVEVAALPGNDVVLRRSRPWNWSLVRDEHGEVVIAVFRAELPAGTWREGVPLTEPLTLWYVYERESTSIYTGDGSKMAIASGPTPNPRGILPITIYTATDSGEPFLQPAYLDQCDAYDICRNSMTDDIMHGVDSTLALKGVNYEELLEKDKEGRSTIEKLREMGLMPLSKEAEAEYLIRVVDVEKFKTDLKTTRQAIHLMAALPDLDETIGGNEGTITNVSGIALKLMFHSMVLQGAEFSRNFTAGLRGRIALLNDYAAALSRPLIPEDVEIGWNKALPSNEVELMLAMPSLAGVVSAREKLRLLPMITDVDASLAELHEDVQAAAPSAAPEATNDIVTG